jgi:hypothetical protein
LSCECLREFLKKFEISLLEKSGAWKDDLWEKPEAKIS